METKTPSPAFDQWFKRQQPQIPAAGARGLLQAMAEGAVPAHLVHNRADSVAGITLRQAYRVLTAEHEWQEIQRRQHALLQELEKSGQLNPELKQTIERSHDLDKLEDLYHPFKPKKSQLVQQAREAGLTALADELWALAHGETPASVTSGSTLAEKAASLAKPESKYPDAETVLKGVADLLVERIAENSELRGLVRQAVHRRSKLRSQKGPKAKQNSKFTRYFDYQEPVGSLRKPEASFRYLQMRKGWMDDELVVSFDRPEEGALLEKFEAFACPNKESIGSELLLTSARLALKGNVYTVMENDTHRFLKEIAEHDVIESLTESLVKKLRQPCLGAAPVMGVEAGSEGQVHAAVVDASGKLLVNTTLKLEDAIAQESVRKEFLQSFDNFKLQAVAVCHGPKAKIIRQQLAQLLQDGGHTQPVLVVHEHFSNIFASNNAAKEEFPELSTDVRRAVFVARYLQDPLTVVVKLDPKFLCLSELHSELNPGQLRRAVNQTLEAAACAVGVDVNRSPAELLAHLPGISLDLAKTIVAEREKRTRFQSREELKTVPGVDGKIYEQTSSFLRIRGGSEPLDATGIHPQHYAAVRTYAAKAGIALTQPLTAEQAAAMAQDPELSAAVGAMQAQLLAEELGYFGQDVRGAFSPFQPVAPAGGLEGLQKDSPYTGVVTNVTGFGAFVDIGLEQDGLVHTSQFDADAKNPLDGLVPGEIVQVWLMGVNLEKKQLSFTMKPKAARPERRPRPPRREARDGEARQARRPRPPRQGQGTGAQAAGGPPAGAEGQPPRERRHDRPRRGEGKGDRPQRADGPKRPPKKPMRDAKTGALMKMDDHSESLPRGTRVASKAKVTTFNPFANLGQMLKDRENKSS